MAFGSFGNLEEVVKHYQIAVRQDRFVQLLPLPVADRFRDRLEFLRQNAPVSASEEAICEFLISPILQEVWVPYSDALMIWSHVALTLDDKLTGYPDYFFSRRSPLGPVRDKPYVLFVEAKKDDFDAAWGQCLAAMLAAQKLNAHPERVILGGVSNGRVWYFGKLEGGVMTQDPRAFTLDDLAELFAALNFLFHTAKDEALAAA
jgi:hypothetical protein